MKRIRNFTVFDGLFLGLFFSKLWHLIPGINWLEVFSPYVVELTFAITAFFLERFELGKRFDLMLWRFVIRVETDRAARKAKREVARMFPVSRDGQGSAKGKREGRP